MLPNSHEFEVDNNLSELIKEENKRTKRESPCCIVGTTFHITSIVLAALSLNFHFTG